MKCEKCGIEMKGSTIVCRVCKHNNAMQRVSAWRAKHSAALQNGGSLIPENAAANPTISPYAESETNLLKFPVLAESEQRPQESVPATEAETAIPAWREKVREKVREAREKRSNAQPSNSDQAATGEAPAEKTNPIVTAALNRIQRSAPPVSRAALAPALAKEDETEIDSSVAPMLPAKGKETKKKPETIQRPETGARVSRTLTELRRNPEAKVQTGQTGQKVITPPANTPPAARVRTAAASSQVVERDQRKPSFNTQPAIAGSKKRIKTQIIEIPRIPEEEVGSSDFPSLWVRTLAGVCDLELIAAGYLPIFAAYVSLQTSIDRGAIIILLLLLAGITFLYQIVSLFIAERTCGMAVLRLRLARTDDQDHPIYRWQKFTRAFAATIAFLFPPLNLLVIHSNERRLSLPDLLSGTLPVEN